ncbi:phospholipase A-2-activating protein [Rickenella mellea]|uniref:Phospholipase A-2-activating protein n=1 Tax=Rickenella mellea TaxID=50990 RepID=A0A4Y7QBA8_9AGAM|nr:phospholipase A-2-activating protein [Rickenella mellea]
MPFKLSATLAAHSSDVRAVSSPSDTIVLSASRDTTAVSWTRPSPTAPFTQGSVYRAGSRYVNAITYVPSTPDAPQGYVVTGGQDTVINVFPLQSEREEPAYSLLGHTENVCALHATASGVIISGSWDRTARVWKEFKIAYELKGHQQSVWAVLAVDDDTFITGSADKSIKSWNQHKCIRTFTGHTDAVRGLALLPDLGFASCSNDSEIRVWTTEGDVIYTLSGHTSFVYSLSVLPNGDIVSGGEDRSVRVWRDGECAQVIVHPAISVWAVSSMPNGDIVSGCSDGVVRVFSSSEERWVPADELKKYDDLIASQALPTQEVGDVKKSDLPGLEALSSPGKKPGEVKMVRNGDKVEAHQWDSASSSWQKVGDVVDAVGSGRKQLYEGKEYDYVFDVDIQDGVPPLKLPYNANENPYSAAQRFLNSNDMPMTYLDQVAKFIEQNTQAVNLSNNEFVDPYTGASRYTASASSVPTGGSMSYADPFTGGSRYTPGSTQPPAPASVLQVAKTSVLPVRTFLSFKQANVPAMHGKLYQLDDAFRHEISTSSLALYPEEIKLLDEALTFLTLATGTPTDMPPASITFAHIETVVQVLERWPSSQRFPVIDLARLLSGYCPEAYAGPNQATLFFRALLNAAEWNEPWQAPIQKPRETNTLLALRALANGLSEDSPLGGGVWVSEILPQVANAPYEMLNKSHRVTLATLLFNLSCVRLKAPINAETGKLHVALLLRILKTETADAETVYRAAVALGNTLSSSKVQNNTLPPDIAGEIRGAVQAASVRFKEERIQVVVEEIKGFM